MTGNQLVAQVRGYFPDGYDEANFFLPHFQAAHNEILTFIRVKKDTTVDLALVYNQFEYAIDPLVTRIWSVIWFTDANNYFVLQAKSLDEWDAINAYWRVLNPSQPIYYDERAGEVWLQPAPSIPTDVGTGYPLVRLYVQKTETVDYDTVIVPNVQSYDAWIFSICLRYAQAKHRDQIPYFQQMYQKAFNQLLSYSQGKAERVKPSLKPNVPIPRVM